MADWLLAQVLHMQTNKRTGPQQEAKLGPFEMCQQIPESESDESGYETPDTFFAKERTIAFTLRNLCDVTCQSHDINEATPISYPTSKTDPEVD